jgi:hypothetical protein
MKRTKVEEDEREEEWDSSNQNSFYEDLDPGKKFVLDDLISTWQNLIHFLVLLKYVSWQKVKAGVWRKIVEQYCLFIL